jgi:hypothetical protein
MSWRDETPQRVQDDLDLLAHEALSTAKSFVGEQDEFYPFGMRLRADGEPEMVGADPGEGEHPASAIVDLLCEYLVTVREDTRAVAFVTPVETSEGDAICVEIEHGAGGPALALVLPYRYRRLRRKVETGELVALPGERRVWTEPVSG